MGIYGYGSIPIKIPCLGGYSHPFTVPAILMWTEGVPGFWHTAISDAMEKTCVSQMLNWHSEISRKFDQCWSEIERGPHKSKSRRYQDTSGISILDVVQTLGATWATNVFPFSRQPCNLAGHFFGAIALYRSWFLVFCPCNYWRTKRFHIRWVVHPHICSFISPCSMGTTSTTPPVSFFMLFCHLQ